LWFISSTKLYITFQKIRFIYLFYHSIF
jgi:hypothetical protein